MSSNSLGYEIDCLQRELSASVDSLIDSKGTDPLKFSEVRAVCQGVVDRYVSTGIFDRPLIVDVNHREEIAYFTTLLQSYIKQAYAATTKEDAYRLRDKAVEAKNRVENLKKRVKDPQRLQVFLKEPYTYEPFDWTKNEF